MNVTRTVFGRHRNGYIFPMLLCVKPMASSFTGMTRTDHFKMIRP